jgi:F-type H+-transporting ATPase subunit a
MSSLVLSVLLAVSPAPEATPAPPPAAHASEKPSVGEAAREAVEGGAHDALTGLEHHAEESDNPALIVMEHVTDVPLGHLKVGGLDLGPTKHLAYLGLTVLVLLAVLTWARYHYDRDRIPRGRVAPVVELILVFIRDEIAEKNIGHDGRKYTPLLASFFSFILVAALIGLLPRASTATGNLSVTLALATVSFLATQWAGIRKFGFVHHFAGMIPSGLPWWLIPVMIPVELLGMFARPFALTVRLFANMIAGHMVITTLLLLIPLMAKVSTALGLIMIPVSLALALFIMFLEILVAFLQAFIFTLLSSIFIGMAAHPAH